MAKSKTMGGERLGGVCRDVLAQFRPSSEAPRALRGEMDWNGGNNGKPEAKDSLSKAKYK